MARLQDAESQWYRALTLDERRSLLGSLYEHQQLQQIDRERAERRLDQWRQQQASSSESLLTYRLRASGATEQELITAIGMETGFFRRAERAQPQWIVELIQSFSNAKDTDCYETLLPKSLEEKPFAGFLNVVGPLIRHGRRRMRHGLNRISVENDVVPFEPNDAENILCEHLLWHLYWMLSRTLVLELNVARLEGRLTGNCSEERFKDFIRRLREPSEALSLLREYPMLARQVTVCVDQWLSSSLEFTARLCEDWEKIRSKFCGGADPGLLSAVRGHAGDRHQYGRSVLIAQLGETFRIAYKPRSMAVDMHYNALLLWINASGETPQLRVLEVLDRGSHGWMEFVEAKHCRSPSSIKRFYQRQGANLALLYVLEATDFHHENLIAEGEFPVLLDLESLFNPLTDAMEPKRADEMAVQSLHDSVLRTGLLPRPMEGPGEAVDFSGLGASRGRLSPVAVPQWEKPHTDEMRYVRKHVPLPGARNRPEPPEITLDVLEQADHIADGFTAMYRFLLIQRETLLSDSGLLAAFAEDEVRVILRSTQTYAVLLENAFHPDMLRDAVDRDLLFDQLWSSTAHSPTLERVVPAEQAALQRADIPRFTARPGSRDLQTCAGECFSDLLAVSGLDRVKRRLLKLDENDLRKQLWFIQASLVTQSAKVPGAGTPTPRAPNSEQPVEQERLVAAACTVGDRLEALAIRGENGVTWLGLSPLEKERWALTPLGTDLYGGLSGIVLFLAYLGKVSGQARFTALARDGLSALRWQSKQERQVMRTIGSFTGWGGFIYTLAHLGSLWSEPPLLKEAEEIVEMLPPLIERDRHFDVVSGAAGCIRGLNSLYSVCPTTRTLDTATRCGDLLIARAKKIASGIGWHFPAFGPQPLAGFSHGAAGIAWSLDALARWTGEDRFQRSAQAATEYERQLYDPVEQNWPDLRHIDGAEPNDGAEFTVAWCHGAPGIGLARADMMRYRTHSALRSEVRAAADTTLIRGFGDNHSLCHGDLGNLELLLLADEVLHESRFGSHTQRFIESIASEVAAERWVCGIPLGVESPGLMTGLAGIGYGLLRLAEPFSVPSVLLLEPPPIRRVL